MILRKFIIIILFLLGFSLLYFLYYRQRNQVELYVSVSVTPSGRTTSQSVLGWIPYWLADSIKIGDKDISPLGGINAEVLDKQDFEALSYGRYIYLLMRVRAIKDRSGLYLYKNKPLLVGSAIDLKLTNSDIVGSVMYIEQQQPQYKKSKLSVKIKALQEEVWVAESLKIGSTIKNNKGDEEIKIIDKKVIATVPIGMRYESQTGKFIYSNDADRRDIEIVVEMNAEKIGDNYYYMKTQKIKVGEWLFLTFKETSLNAQITSVDLAK